MPIARFFSLPDNFGKSVKCELCHYGCQIPLGGEGRCRIRHNMDGKMALPFYANITALAVDPIEKKPLYHFRPGTEILSAGFAGCNLHCPFCQNWRISQTASDSKTRAAALVQGREYTAAGLIAQAGKSKQLAYTYSEPLVHIEYLLDCMKEARKAGIANVLVSNGCVNPEAADEVLELTDAANIDLKCFSKDTYKNILGGDLSTVTGFISRAVEKGVHLELTTLVVPGLNDSDEELGKCRDFIAELENAKAGSASADNVGGNFVPWHLSAYHPDYKWKAPPTDPASLIAAAKRAREKLGYVYTGNISHEAGFNDTSCLSCGKTLIRRQGYRIDMEGLNPAPDEKGRRAYFCRNCAKPAPVRWN